MPRLARITAFTAALTITFRPDSQCPDEARARTWVWTFGGEGTDGIACFPALDQDSVRQSSDMTWCLQDRFRPTFRRTQGGSDVSVDEHAPSLIFGFDEVRVWICL